MSTELYHYGVKGMHWGHRKQRPVSKGVSRTPKTKIKPKKKYNYGKETNRELNRRSRFLVTGAFAGNAAGAYLTDPAVRYVAAAFGAKAIKRMGGSKEMAYSMVRLMNSKATKATVVAGSTIVGGYLGNSLGKGVNMIGRKGLRTPVKKKSRR